MLARPNTNMHTNLLQTPEEPHASAVEETPQKTRRASCWFVGFLLLVFFAAFAPLVYGGTILALAGRDLNDTISRARSHIAARDIDALDRDAGALTRGLAEWRRGLAATAWWKSAPWVGPRIMAADGVAAAGGQIIDALRPLLGAARALQDAAASVGLSGAGVDLGVAPQKTFRDLSKEEKRVILARLQESLPALRETRDKLTIAREAWNRVPREELIAPLRDALEPAATRLFALTEELNQSVSLLEIGIPLAGYPRTRTFLVLLQNADEIRPTGGFIGTIGLVQPDSGEIGHIDFGDVYALDKLVIGKWKDVPPDPLKRELGVNAWYLRDANWSPDYPQSAARIMDVYERERSMAGLATTTLDGVIALNPDFFRALLHLTGPIKINGKTFDEENFFDELEYDVEQGFLAEGKPVLQRKEIVSQVGDALADHLLRLPASRWPKLLTIISRSLERKDILLAMREPSLMSLMDARGWTGRIKAAPQDYLMVVDANLAALKTDGVMEKNISYQTDYTNLAGPMATLTLTYRNMNRDFSWRYTRYRDYVRVYVPEGSELLFSEGAMLNDRTKTGGRVIAGNTDVFRDLGKTVFGAFLAIEPGETRTLRLTYRLPSFANAEDPHTLVVQRQPGANTRLTLDLNFGKKVVSASPSEDPEEHGDTRYRLMTTLDRDRSFEVRTR